MDALHGRAGRDAELVVEQHTKAIEGEQGLRGVAALFEGFHQDAVARFTVRRELDEVGARIPRPGADWARRDRASLLRSTRAH